MADCCHKCGKSFSGMFGTTPIGPKSTEKLKQILSLDCSGMCIQCAGIALNDERLRRNMDLSTEIRKRIAPQIQRALDKITLQTVPHSEHIGGTILGVVSGYSVIGTGVLSEFFSSFTDFFGLESNAYLEKIRKGEKSSMLIAKKQAFDMGADLISGFNISVTEATSGHGMLMVSCSGTAVQTKGADLSLMAEMKKLEEAVLLESLFIGVE